MQHDNKEIKLVSSYGSFMKL